MLHVISLGAGVQSTAMALMAAHGELKPTPDCAIFADTGAEPAAVYEHLKWLRSWSVLPFPVWVVSAGNIAEDLKRGMSDVGGLGQFAAAPFFIKKMKSNGASFEVAMGAGNAPGTTRLMRSPRSSGGCWVTNPASASHPSQSRSGSASRSTRR